MTRFKTFLAVIFLAGGTTFTPAASAQTPTYSPLTPTISPWMGLWRENTGALDNYHTFVRPQMELNETLQMQNAALNHQASRLQGLSNEIMQPQGSQSGMVPTGQGAGFMNTSHYFSGNRPSARPATPRQTSSRAGPSMPSVPGLQ